MEITEPFSWLKHEAELKREIGALEKLVAELKADLKEKNGLVSD